jgi:hypothetical protein
VGEEFSERYPVLRAEGQVPSTVSVRATQVRSGGVELFSKQKA